MAGIYDEIYVRSLKTGNPTEKDYLLGETETGTKLFTLQSVKNLFYSAQVYKTLDAMKVTEFEEGDLCYTTGYRKADDGGAAMYVIVYEPTLIQDGGLTHALSTSNTLRAKMILMDNRVNVHQFGAYGDGTHDDTIAIQTAINTGMKVEFTCNKSYKITKPLKLTKSNQVLNFNNAIIVPYNGYALSIEGSETNYVQNIRFNDLVLRCNNDGSGIKAAAYTKNIYLNNFRFNDIRSNNRGFLIDSCESFTAEHGFIIGDNYDGTAFYLTSTDSQNKKRKIVLNDIVVSDMNRFCKVEYADATTSVVLNDCKFINTDLMENNLSTALYITGSFSTISIRNFACVNANEMIYTSSEADGNITIDDLYVYDNRNVYNLNSIASNNKVILKGDHTYKGTNVEPKYKIFANMYSSLHNYCVMTYETDITYKVLADDMSTTGRLCAIHMPELEEEQVIVSNLSTSLVVNRVTNTRYDWTGDLLLKNIIGFEGQILMIRSTINQEISSGGNIVLYPETPEISFKEVMSSIPYKFKCISGKWVRIG